MSKDPYFILRGDEDKKELEFISGDSTLTIGTSKGIKMRIDWVNMGG